MRKSKFHFSFIGALLIGIGFMSFKTSENEFVGQANHTKWDQMLRANVSSNGNVNYKNFKAKEAQLDDYLKHLGENVPSSSASTAEKKAYWMNAYNAFTVKLIVKNYPLKSIKDVGNPWKIKFIELGGKTYDLNTIEHEILRKMGDPRIHVGINCASKSCPKLHNKAFTAANVNAELDKLTKAFINDPSRNKINANAVQLSKIFDWFKGDFTKKGTLIEYLNKYSKVKISSKAKISYLNYSWSLNL